MREGVGMTRSEPRYAGGGLSGWLRYEVEGEALYMGHCCCADCRKASGSGFIPYMGFASSAVRFRGETLSFTSKAANGGGAVRNSRPLCGSPGFGGKNPQDDSFTIYPGTLGYPSWLRPPSPIFPPHPPT